MKFSCICSFVTLTSTVYACQSEHKHVFEPHRALEKRQERVFPPVLTEQESVLINSVDNVTIDEWYCY